MDEAEDVDDENPKALLCDNCGINVDGFAAAAEAPVSMGPLKVALVSIAPEKASVGAALLRR